MLVKRRKREKKHHNKRALPTLEQVTQMKYLGIILDHEFKFQDHITYVPERCTKIIHNLSRAAILSWGLKNEVVAVMYKGAIPPLLTSGAPGME